MKENILKDAAKAAILSGAFVGVARFMESKDSKKNAILESSIVGLKTAIAEGGKAILKNKNSAFKAVSKPASITKSVFNACAQTALESANDINKYYKGEISKSTCITRVAENAGGVIGSMVLGRAAMIVGAAALPAMGGVAGAVTLGLIGGYVGEKIGKKIVNGELFGKKDSKQELHMQDSKDTLLTLTKELKSLKGN
ncbi:hypothetical protein DCO58_02010 [Helicobacter saguini]|uniref:Uncharacterized protein n=1 Tax=Helicobacter saguini TaxID=1548018 RepID=A0A347VRM6_9HELI|nr:hypothetical protein [Helicobacter saguini]MWV62847.1 hypothetical protein [Helicobacter saguini]MWV66484.1 hypothetical protein [Helicobacter saguini]MWV68833.1 hypothetical protein [Helicobacter saguini]MWV71612.1 hypothetical protein [Helicobacter saguini]TLD94416.1 hypothetical protein LS64_005665 [Helicobacter saguini]